MPNDGALDEMGMPNADGMPDEMEMPNRGGVPNEMNMSENKVYNNNVVLDNIGQKGQTVSDIQENMNFM